MTTTLRPHKGASKSKAKEPYVMTTADKVRMAFKPSLNGAVVIQTYQGNIMGKEADLNALIDQLRDTFTEVKGGDLHTLEAMLISQATALQTIFTSLARRAQDQQYQKNLESFFGAGLESAGAKQGHPNGAGGLEVPKASHVCEAGQYCQWAVTGKQRRGGWRSSGAIRAGAHARGKISTRAKQTIPLCQTSCHL